MVAASVISAGALFHNLPVSLTKLSSAVLFFPHSFIFLLVDGLTVRSVSLSSSPSAFLNFIGKSLSLLAFQSSVSFIWAEVWFTDSKSNFFSISAKLYLSLILLPSSSRNTLF